MRNDRVREHTAAEVLKRIDGDAEERLVRAVGADRGMLGERLASLEREWDVDRAIETEAAVVSLAGLALGAAAHRAFFALPGVAAAMLLTYAVSGWYPWLPLMRRAGIRTAGEIQRERYALKALRGDFDGMGTRGRAGTEEAVP